MNDVMIDLETLGTTPSAVIMSIGAVRFDLETGRIEESGFYASISIDSNLEAGRSISEDTLLWWLKQSEAARQVFTEPKQPLDIALNSFTDWFEAHSKSGRTRVWSNGADFDLPLLVHTYHSFGSTPPWDFRDTRCVRTYRSLPAASRIAKPAAGVAHNALADAVNQARHVMAIHAEMTSQPKVTA